LRLFIATEKGRIMRNSGKQALVPYEPLIDFASKEITDENWSDVLSELGGRPVPKGMTEEQKRKWWNETYRRLGWLAPRALKDKLIDGPEPLREVQGKLQKDLARITDPKRDFEPSAEDFESRRKSVHKVFEESRQQGLSFAERLKKANSVPGVPVEKNLGWLIEERYQRLTSIGKPWQTTHKDKKTPMEVQKVGEMTIPMALFAPRSRAVNGDWRVFATDRVYLLPVIDDLLIWVYFRLAKLWEDGLLPQVERCERCEKFFLAKTRRKGGTAYCSQSCAQGKTAPARAKASRARRAEWESVRKDLERDMVLMRTLHRSTERKALAQGENTLQKAERAFQEAYPRKQGPGYEEGEKLLAQAKKQVNQLRKTVKGY
jgi:hypothetical protein